VLGPKKNMVFWGKKRTKIRKGLDHEKSESEKTKGHNSKKSRGDQGKREDTGGPEATLRDHP